VGAHGVLSKAQKTKLGENAEDKYIRQKDNLLAFRKRDCTPWYPLCKPVAVQETRN
jgi:hypothetical protein